MKQSSLHSRLEAKLTKIHERSERRETRTKRESLKQRQHPSGSVKYSYITHTCNQIAKMSFILDKQMQAGPLLTPHKQSPKAARCSTIEMNAAFLTGSGVKVNVIC